MSLITILAILPLIIICTIPFVIINIRNKKAERKFLQILIDFASENSISISQYDVLGNQIIGLSEKTNSIFFLKRRNNKDQILQVDLAQIERCYVNKPTRSGVDGNYSVTDRTELRFAFRDKNKPETVFELYNLEYDSMSMSGELQLAEKWHSIANGRIKKRES
jgi:hypothetical protein